MDIASTNLSRLLVHTFLPSLNIYSSNPTNLSKEIRSLRFSTSNRLKKEDDVSSIAAGAPRDLCQVSMAPCVPAR